MKYAKVLFTIGLLFGVYAYVLFFLGMFKFLTFMSIFITASIFFITMIYLLRNLSDVSVRALKKEEVFLLIFVLISLLIVILGAFIPETAFDALWYHLTLPKLYLIEHSILFYPGNLLQYSGMPKFGELLYIPTLLFRNETTSHLLHIIFGIGSVTILYLFSKRYMNRFFSILSVVIFIGNIVFLWEGTTAYVDLFRTFYEISSIYALILWTEEKQSSYFFISAILLGFAIMTKMLALESLGVILGVISWYEISQKEKIWSAVLQILKYVFVSLVIPLPWFIFAAIYTGNPIYPFFSSHISIPTSIHVTQFPLLFWRLFMQASDPVSPVYVMVLPLLFLLARKEMNRVRYIFFYAVGVIFLSVMTPQIGGGRFILPYLPVLSLLSAYTIAKTQSIYLKKIMIISVILVCLLSFSYRAFAEVRALPYLLGKESKSTYLAKHLNFSFGDFYDIDGYFAKHITSRDKVLLVGFHNLYYVNFPFIHDSWLKPTDRFNYIAVQNTYLPQKYNEWKKIYHDDITHVTLYAKK